MDYNKKYPDQQGASVNVVRKKSSQRSRLDKKLSRERTNPQKTGRNLKATTSII